MARTVVEACLALSCSRNDSRQRYCWKNLDDELALWSRQGRVASFWWRDDDACAATPQLETLLQFSEEFSIPVSLSVVPARLDRGLCKRLVKLDQISVLQHGYAHRNHAPAEEKKSEYGAHRSVTDMVVELLHGQMTLRHRFGEQFYTVLVPPWNRYTPTLLPGLAAAGYRGISAMWARVISHASAPACTQSGDSQVPLPIVAAPLHQVNTHSDPVAWRHDRGFIGESETLEQLVCHLRLRREYPQLGDEPTGLLSHHLEQTESVWAFCRRFAERINRDNNCVWLQADDIW